MYALRERRQHVTQEDFEFAVAKVCALVSPMCTMIAERSAGAEEEPGSEHISEQVVLVVAVGHCSIFSNVT